MHLNHRYHQLGEAFYKASTPAAASHIELFLWNSRLAAELNIEPTSENIATLAGQVSAHNPPPIALAYAGHQFGNFVPSLGDGRAHLLGDIQNTSSGDMHEIQLKGSGTTPYSRGGDGLCALGPAIREFVMSESMHALGVPTTQSLSVVTTGDTAYRETPLPGAIVARVAHSHIRVGSFQYFLAKGDIDSLKTLANEAAQRHYPEIFNQKPDTSVGNAYSNYCLALLNAIMNKQISLVVEWMRVGFIHGVQNTDNTLISGDTIDFGPCAMMDTYNPSTVFSSIDRRGRYAFANQAPILHWNLTRLFECFIPLINDDEDTAINSLSEILSQYESRYMHAFLSMMCKKLGLDEKDETSETLINDLFKIMEANAFDYTLTFDALTECVKQGMRISSIPKELESYVDKWLILINKRHAQDNDPYKIMRAANPVIIPRNHNIEQCLHDCTNSMQADAANRLLSVLSSPYDEAHRQTGFYSAPEKTNRQYNTFCGT